MPLKPARVVAASSPAQDFVTLVFSVHHLFLEQKVNKRNQKPLIPCRRAQFQGSNLINHVAQHPANVAKSAT
jgi:hypothetical protein